MKCPHCNQNIDVRFIKAPPDAQASTNNHAPNLSRSDDLGELLEAIIDDTLSGGELKFVQETRERYEKYGAKTRMSEKQISWLRRIASGESQAWE